MSDFPTPSPVTYNGGSSIPYAVNNLMALAQAVLQSDYLVYMGSTLAMFTAPITLQICNVIGDQQPESLSPAQRRMETYSISCCLWSRSGEQVMFDRLNEVFTAWQTLTDAIANDPKLTGVPGGNNNAFGVVLYAQVGNMNFTSAADKPGFSLGQLQFNVRCQARISALD